MNDQMSIAVVGAGPGGLAIALMLSRLGHDITIFERFDQARPVGSGLMLQPTGMTVLASLGLLDDTIARGSRIDRLWGADSQTSRIVLDVRYAARPGGRFGLGIHRASLFDVLHQAVLASACRWQLGHDIIGHTYDNGTGYLTDAEGARHGGFDLVVDASGASSQLSAALNPANIARPLEFGAFWATLPARSVSHDRHALVQRYRRANVMVGLLPAGRRHADGEDLVAFFWSLKVADAARVRDGGLDAWKKDVLGHWPELDGLLAELSTFDDLTLARYRHRTMPVPHGAGIVCLGDAAHSTSPQLGQGANMALLDAASLAAAIHANPGRLADALAAHAANRKTHVRLFQALSLAFTPFYQSESRLLPWLRDTFVSSVAQVPPVQSLLSLIVSGMLGGPFKGTALSEHKWVS